MKARLLAALSLLLLCFTACDETTEDIGQSLTDNIDKLDISTQTFSIKETRSILADSVLSRNTIGYLGKIKDPETGAYITGNFMVQFNTLENYRLFPDKKYILSKDEDGEICADSCEISLYFDEYYGDSIALMRLSAMEMGKPMKENVKYYSNFDPEKEGYIREGANAIRKSKLYTLADTETSYKEKQSSDYTPQIRIKLNGKYTDKDNKEYNNYGTYILRKYFENPEYFKNSYNFVENICPGFYMKMEDGIGSMAYISMSQLNLYYKYKGEKDTVESVIVTTFSGTEEVLQTTNIVNDKKILKQLADSTTCTYLKTPAGIFTEMELPIDEIMSGHKNDTINTAEIVFTRKNNNLQSQYTLDVPETLMMIPRDSLYTFFENGDVVDYKMSYLATNTQNTYTYHNISSMISSMADAKANGRAGKNWNKIVLVPVKITTSSSGSIVKVVHDMSMTSTKLVGGDNTDIKINVIYSKFRE